MDTPSLSLQESLNDSSLNIQVSHYSFHINIKTAFTLDSRLQYSPFGRCKIKFVIFELDARYFLETSSLTLHFFRDFYPKHLWQCPLHSRSTGVMINSKKKYNLFSNNLNYKIILLTNVIIDFNSQLARYT